MRRKRIDSISGAAEIAAAAQREIKPAIDLDRRELSCFKRIIDEAPKIEWTPHQVETACILARNMVLLDEEQVALKREGTTIEGRTNPRVHNVQMLVSIILRIRASLGLSARERQKDKPRRDEWRQRAKEIEAQVSESSPFDETDDLLN